MNAASEEFKWCNGADEIVIRERRAVAVYPNPWGAVVIRAERAWDEEADACILAPVEFEADDETVTSRPRGDRTNAKRQRRYRKQRNAARNGAETVMLNADDLPLLTAGAGE